MILQDQLSRPPKGQQLRITKHFFLIMLLVIICFGSFVIGYEMVAITMLERPIANINGLDSDNLYFYLTLATAMMPLGAIFGCFATRKFQSLGENRLMILSDALAVGSCLLMVRSLGVVNLCISRLLVGISCGVSSSVIPTFLVSLAPPQWRGLMGSLHQLFVTVGIGFSFYLGQRLSELAIFGLSNWQSYLFLPVFYACVRIILLFFFRFNSLESHYDNGDTATLQLFMKFFYNKVDINQFVATMRLTKEKIEQDQGVKGKLLTVSIIILALNQLSGINVVLSYSKQLFMKVSYYNEERADYFLEVLAIVQIMATLIGGYFANIFGRKRILILGGYVSTAALFSIFLVYSISPKSVMLLVILIVIFTIAYAGSVGVVPLLYLGQIFSNLSQINIIFWSFSLLGMLSSNLMLAHLGIGKSFFIYGVISFVCTHFLASQMIESQQKTRKQLRNEYLYQNKYEGSVLQYASMKTADPLSQDNNSVIENDQ